ncbi:MAG: hypothetical protein NT154_26440 [Verrucomicrobia bacterium]|nr:hypothetical protein [Verrucomicrobiota bacterium]
MKKSLMILVAAAALTQHAVGSDAAVSRFTLDAPRFTSLTQYAVCSDAASGKSTKTQPADVYRLLGYATMSSESPLQLWGHLRETRDWLVGPLSPDAWAGQVFIADHADIFAFRFLPVPAAWTKESAAGHRVEYCAGKYADWFKNWSGWWKVVGPKAWDNSYARLVWQMPDGGPEVTYEWAQVGTQTVVGRITQSNPCDLVIEGYSPWVLPASPRFAIYADGPERRSLHGRSWLPGTRDGMRWVLAVSAPAQETTGNGGVLWHGFYPQVKTLYFAARQGQTYEQLEPATRSWLEGRRIDELLERNRARYLQARPVGSGWLADAPAAINDQIEWSEVYTPSRRRPYLTVSRGWAQSNNSAPDFLWDSFFTALLVSQEDRARSFNTMRDITAWQNDQGMFAQYGEWFAKMTRASTRSPGATRSTRWARWRPPRSVCVGRIGSSWPRCIRACSSTTAGGWGIGATANLGATATATACWS